MSKRRIVGVVAICVLAACTEDGSLRGATGWEKPEATHADFQKDTDECRRIAVLRPMGSSGAVTRSAEVRRAYNDCMIGRGWTLSFNNSEDKMNEIVNCKLPATEQTQRMSARDCHNRYGKIL